MMVENGRCRSSFIPHPSSFGYDISLEVALGTAGPDGRVVLLPVDLPQVVAHAGHEGALELERLEATLPDGLEVPVQYLPAVPGLGAAGAASVALALPAGMDGARLTLRVPAVTGAALESKAARVVFSQGPASVFLGVDGVPFATYRYQTADPALPRPYFHPIMGPAGVAITQEGEFPGTTRGHIWHTGMVLAHQNFTDGNNWQTGSPNYSRMRHVAFDAMESGPLVGRFVERLEWLSVKGDRVVFRETRSVTLPAGEPGGSWSRRRLDVDTTITCGDSPATWNATPYHLLAIRLPDEMLVGKGGAITNSEGILNRETAGAPARWLDYSGPLGGKVCGVALFDHPKNPRHPTPWLNFENQTIGAAPTYKEPLAWSPGQSVRFRYRVYFHTGDVTTGGVAEEYTAYASDPAVRIGQPLRVEVEVEG